MSVLIFKAQNRRDRSQKIRFPDGAAFKNYRIGGIYPFLDHGNHGVDLGAAQFIDFEKFADQSGGFFQRGSAQQFESRRHTVAQYREHSRP